MNGTNRGVNRVVLVIVGCLLLAGGGLTASALLVPAVGDAWHQTAVAVGRWADAAHRDTQLALSTTLSWFAVGVLVALLLLVVIAVVIVSRLGGGRSDAVIREEALEGVQGAVTIAQGFASDAISHALDGRSDILSARVHSRRMRGAELMHVSVTPRQNTSPVEVAQTVGTLVDNLAALTGGRTPTLVSIHSGIRSRLAADRPRVS